MKDINLNLKVHLYNKRPIITDVLYIKYLLASDHNILINRIRTFIISTGIL